MQNIKKLIAAGKNLEALQALAASLEGENKNAAILCLSQYNVHWQEIHKGTEYRNPIEINQIMWRALLLCDHKILDAIEKGVAQPPMLDNLPLDKDGYLLGRKAALEELHATLQGQGTFTLVNGVGGIGKSTLASFYATFPKYRATYQHCFWITVSDLTGEIEEALISAFLEALALSHKPKEEQLQKIATYLLSLEGQTLLILDNANDDKKVRASLEFFRTCKCKVLFTTRTNMQHLKSLPLAKLLPEDAFTLFTHYYPEAKEMPEIPQLLKNIDYHTLLTEFMAKSLNHNPTHSLQDLIAITQQQNFTDEILAHTQFPTYHTHTHSKPDIEIQPAVYLLQIFSIQNLSEQEQEILRYFSILPATWIEKEMWLQLFVEKALKKEIKSKGFFSAIKNLFSKPKEVVETNHIKNDLQLGQVLQSLHEKGWLQKSPTNAFACHILVQHLLRQQLQPNAENCELLLENLCDATWFDGYIDTLKLSHYLPLIITILNWIKEDTKSISVIYNNSAEIYQAIGNYKQALIYNKENVRIKEKILSDDDTFLAAAYNNIGETYRYLGDYQKALEYGLKALTIWKKILSPEDSLLANSYNNISGTYEKLGNYQKALEFVLKALSIQKKVLNPEHPHLATSYNNISGIYEKLGNYQKALEYGLSALAIREKALSPENPDLVSSYNNVGVVYSKLNYHQKSLDYKLKALTIRKKILSPEHPDVAISYSNIGETYRHLTDYKKSLEYGLLAIDIKEKILSSEHPSLATSYNNVALTYYYLKNYATAYTYIQKAVAIVIKVLPKGHPDIQNFLNAKAMIEKAMRKK